MKFKASSFSAIISSYVFINTHETQKGTGILYLIYVQI